MSKGRCLPRRSDRRGQAADRSQCQPCLRRQVQNISGVLNRPCQEHHRSAPETCIYEDVNAPFVATPLFLWQSAVDSDQLGGDGYEPPCSSAECAVPFAEGMAASLSAHVFDKERHGGFLDYCHHHCGDHHQMRSDGSNLTRGQALHWWYQGGARVYNQTATFASEGFPCTTCCSGAPLSLRAVSRAPRVASEKNQGRAGLV